MVPCPEGFQQGIISFSRIDSILDSERFLLRGYNSVFKAAATAILKSEPG